MNKYTELSDLEINKHVFVVAKIEHEDTDLHSNKVFYGDGAKWIEFDPCNNPTDAMPIIIENLISLMADMSEDRESTWWCASDISNGITSRYKSNPLRAAMEVFLMMKDAENEKV